MDANFGGAIGNWSPTQLLRFLAQLHRPKAVEAETLVAGKLLHVEDELILSPRAITYIKKQLGL